MKNLTKFNNKIFILVVLVLALLLFSACTSSSSEPDNSEEMGEMGDMAHEDSDMEEMNHDEEEMDDHDMEDMEHSHDDGIQRIPNQDGATISIMSPEDGSTFAHGEQIIVEVAVENFELDNDGSHWHIYIDGSSWGMVMGQNTEQALTGIEPGEHEIATYLAIGTHEEFEDGDSIMIIIE